MPQQFSNIIKNVAKYTDDCLPEGRLLNTFNILFASTPQFQGLPFPFDNFGDQLYYGVEIDPTADAGGRARLSQVRSVQFDWQTGFSNSIVPDLFIGPLYIYNEYTQQLNTIMFNPGMDVNGSSNPYGDFFVRGVIPFESVQGAKVIVVVGVGAAVTPAGGTGSLSLAFSNYELPVYDAQGALGFTD
jgi:hypothetical protein